jgi:hypothetical protein
VIVAAVALVALAVAVLAVVLWPEDRPAGSSAATSTTTAAPSPAQLDVVGSDLSGVFRDRQADLAACENTADGCNGRRSRHVSFSVLCQGEECFLAPYPGFQWSPGAVTRDERSVTASGAVPEQWAHTCRGRPVPTTWSVDLRITEVEPAGDGWAAVELGGTYEERSGAGECAGVVLSYDVVAEVDE